MTREDWIAAFEGILDAQWKDHVPDAVDRALVVAREWNLDLREPLPGATCSLLFAGFEGEREVVLRLPLAEEEAGPGFRAMKAFSGHGGVEVLREIPDLGLTLMPRLRPGWDLGTYRRLAEGAKIRTAAQLYNRLHASPLVDAWSHDRWFQELWQFELPSDSLISPELFEFGKELGRWLLDTTTAKVLLHGDLHHFNILLDGKRWVAIDPKGVIGDPAFEPAAFLRNPVPQIAEDPNLVHLQQVRLWAFSTFMHQPVERIWGWAVAQVILDAAWSDGQWNQAWAAVAEATMRARPPEADYLPWPIPSPE